MFQLRRKKLPKPYDYRIPIDQNQNYWKCPFFAQVLFKINSTEIINYLLILLHCHHIPITKYK